MKRILLLIVTMLVSGQVLASSTVTVHILNQLSGFNLKRTVVSVNPLSLLRGHSFTKKTIGPGASDRGAFYQPYYSGYETRLVYNVTTLNNKVSHACELIISSSGTLKLMIATNTDLFCIMHEKNFV